MLNQARVCAPHWGPKQHAVHGAGKANCEAHSLHNRRTKSKVETFLISSGENHRLIAATHVEIRAVAVTVLAPAWCHAAPWPLSTWQRLQLVDLKKTGHASRPLQGFEVFACFCQHVVLAVEVAALSFCVWG